MREKITAVWLKKDLRAKDHAPLWEASQKCLHLRRPALAFFVLEEDYWTTEKASQAQKSFALECLDNLNKTLTQIGGHLHLLRAPSCLEALQNLTQTYQIQEVLSHLEIGNKWTYQRDKKVQKFLKSQGIPWKQFAANPLQRGSKSYFPPTDHPVPLPKLWIEPAQSPPLNTPIPQSSTSESPILKGGEETAQTLLQSFLTERVLAHEGYRSCIGHPIKSEVTCSRLSPHLTWGSLSQKTLLQVVSQTEPWHPQLTKQLSAFQTRIAWRTHFMQGFETQWEMEHKCLNPQTENLRGWNEENFQRWASGQTGYPFIDACMRKLLATQWLHFRARAMITCFAAFGLNLDWRGFGPHLAQNFLDYEPGIHYWQLQMQSGTTHHTPPRLYNPLKQSLEKDPTGEFIRKWVPELRHLSNSEIHLPLQPPKNYPKAIVPPEKIVQTLRSHCLRNTSKHNPQLELPL